MGGGAWTEKDFVSYSASVGRSTVRDKSSGTMCFMADDFTAQEVYKSRYIQPELDPMNVTRECCDSDEHPNTIPVILALDVTGSMGKTAVMVASKLNEVITKLFDTVADVEFCVMGIGDLSYDYAPIQISQFESDIRIAEQLDKVYFEGGGGGNSHESYTAAWYMGLNHTKLDCWKRGKKGIIITMGDEPMNPYLPHRQLTKVVGDTLQADVETKDLYERVIDKFDVYHLAVDGGNENSYKYHKEWIAKTWGQYLDDEHFSVTTIDGIASKIVEIVTNAASGAMNTPVSAVNENGEITW